MSYNVFQNSSLVGIGYITTEFSKAYPIPHESFDVLFSQAGRSIDITARILGDLESFNYNEAITSGTKTLASWLGDIETYCNPSYIAPLSGYPDSVPSGISDGINLLENAIGDMAFPADPCYWNQGATTFGVSLTKSITDEISVFIENKRVGIYTASGPSSPRLIAYNPITAINQGSTISPIVSGQLGGYPPMNNVIGVDDYSSYAVVSGWVIPSPLVYSYDSHGIPVVPDTTVYPDTSGIWPLTIDERLERLNEYENLLQNVLVQKLTYPNRFSPLIFSASAQTRTFTVPNGANIDSLTFKLWGGGGGGGRAVSIWDSNKDNATFSGTGLSTGTGGAPGGYLTFTISGFNAGDRFIIYTGANGYPYHSSVYNWALGADQGSAVLPVSSISGGASWIRYYNSKTSVEYELARCNGGQGGIGGSGRLAPGISAEYSSTGSYTRPPVVGSTSLTPNLLGQTNLTVVSSASNTGVYYAEGNSIYVSPGSGGSFVIRSHSTKPRVGDGWYSGGAAVSNNGYGTGGCGADGKIWYGFPSASVQTWPGNGDPGRVEISWVGYSYLPNPGGVDTRWLAWRRDW
jgi:hypothetical protein